VSVLGEDLHPRPLVASVAHHKLSRAFHHRNLARVATFCAGLTVPTT
jgi:hypothetical protein